MLIVIKYVFTYPPPPQVLQNRVIKYVFTYPPPPPQVLQNLVAGYCGMYTA